MKKFGIAWSLQLTNEGGFIVALLAGTRHRQFLARVSPNGCKEAVRPELYVKTAIVILGGFLGVTAADKLVSRRRSCSSASRRSSRPISSSGRWSISSRACGSASAANGRRRSPPAFRSAASSAAIATGGAIRARPVVPVMVSSLVVVFAVVELLILPFLAQTFLYHEPLVAGAWMGLAVKTDGAAVAGGAITEALILAKNAGGRRQLSAGLGARHDGDGESLHRRLHRHLGVRARVHLDATHRCATGDRAKAGEIWQRFPKFIIGYVLTFAIGLYLALAPRPRHWQAESRRWAKPTRSAASSSC